MIAKSIYLCVMVLRFTAGSIITHNSNTNMSDETNPTPEVVAEEVTTEVTPAEETTEVVPEVEEETTEEVVPEAVV
jgi:hypothetical protein